MENSPYTPEQVEEIKVLDGLVEAIEGYARGKGGDQSWLKTLVSTPKALRAGAFTGLDPNAIEEAKERPVACMDARIARASFLRGLNVVRAYAAMPSALRHALADDNCRFTGIIRQMAYHAGLRPEAPEDPQPNWTGVRFDETVFCWTMPDGATVRATSVVDNGETLWNFWVQKGQLMYCSLTVGTDGGNPDGDPEFEECAQAAWHDAQPVLSLLSGHLEQPCG